MNNRRSELNLFFSTPVWTSKIDNHSEINLNILKFIKNMELIDSKGIQK